ncbi:hypothetical protein ACFQ9X_43800 [Catenulispora yoronensis]
MGDLRLYFFTATSFAGEPRESDEIAADWIPEAEIPYDRMWDDTHRWLPDVIAGEYVVMDFDYAGRDKVAGYRRLASRPGGS